jgi:uncharacterized protein
MPPESRPAAPLESALADYLRRREAPAELARDARGFFEKRGASAADAAELESPLARSRFELYRELVHARLYGAVDATLPRTVLLLGSARIEAEIAAFLEEQPSSSPYLREVVVDFVAFVAPRWPTDASLPPHALDLARFELAHVEVAAGFDDEPREARDPSADAPVLVQRAARLERLGHAVHRLAEGAAEAPEPGAHRLLGYRDLEGRTRFLELSPLAAHLFERLREAEPLGAAVQAACVDADLACDDAALAEIAALLDDLAERGVLLGAG